MRSRLPKPLHRICGREMVRYPVELLKAAGAERVIVVVSPENQDAIRAVLGDVVEYAVQPQRDGTAGALSCCAPLLQGPGGAGAGRWRRHSAGELPSRWPGCWKSTPPTQCAA